MFVNHLIILFAYGTVCRHYTHRLNKHRGSFYVAVQNSNVERREAVVLGNIHELRSSAYDSLYSAFNISNKHRSSLKRHLKSHNPLVCISSEINHEYCNFAAAKFSAYNCKQLLFA